MADYPFPYNGRSASFNWASIPLAAVERLEVLTAGASSIYGSDAIAGVINVVLVEGVEETSVRVNAGNVLMPVMAVVRITELNLPLAESLISLHTL